MPSINHRRPSTLRTCLGGRCCAQCGFVCHRHWIATEFPTGIRQGETPQEAWGRQPVHNPDEHHPMPRSIERAIGNPITVVARGTTTWGQVRRNDGIVEPPRITNTSRRNMSYDTVVRGRRAPNAPAQPGDRLITDQEIMDALNEPF